MLDNEYSTYVINIYRRVPHLRSFSCHFHIACQSHVDPNSLQKETWYYFTAIFIRLSICLTVKDETWFPQLIVTCLNTIISFSVLLSSHVDIAILLLASVVTGV